MFSGTAKKVLCLLCCFCQVVFGRFCVTDDICTFSLIVGAPGRRLRTRWCRRDWEKFLWIWLNWICLLCSVWNVKGFLFFFLFAWTETDIWTRSHPFQNHTHTHLKRLNHFVSRTNSLGDNRRQPWRESNHWDSPPSFLLPRSRPPLPFPGQQDGRSCSLLVTQQISLCF